MVEEGGGGWVLVVGWVGWHLYRKKKFKRDILVVLTYYLISMLCILEVMHCYWTIFLLKAQFNSYFKNKIKVEYDVRDRKPLRR